MDTDSDCHLLEHEVEREIELEFGGPNGNLTKKNEFQTVVVYG